MTYLPKTAYWGHLVPNYESVDKTTNPYFKNSRILPVVENEAQFVLVKYIFNMLKYPCVHGKLQNIKKFSNEIFKRTRSGKQNLEESSRIEGCVNTNI